MARSGESARSLEEELLEVARAFGERGVAMGELVDRVVARGSAVEAIEAAIWGLLGARLLTPSGFVCRLLRQPGGGGSSPLRRSYELRLAVWSPELDGDAEREGTDASEASEATDASEAADASEASEGTDAINASDPTGAAEAIEAIEASDVAGAPR